MTEDIAKLKEVVKYFTEKLDNKAMTTDDVELQISLATGAANKHQGRGGERLSVERLENEITIKMDEFVFIQFLKIGQELWRGKVHKDFVDNIERRYPPKKPPKEDFEIFIEFINSLDDNNAIVLSFIKKTLAEKESGDQLKNTDVEYDEDKEMRMIGARSRTLFITLRRVNAHHWEAIGP